MQLYHEKCWRVKYGMWWSSGKVSERKIFFNAVPSLLFCFLLSLQSETLIFFVAFVFPRAVEVICSPTATISHHWFPSLSLVHQSVLWSFFSSLWTCQSVFFLDVFPPSWPPGCPEDSAESFHQPPAGSAPLWTLRGNSIFNSQTDGVWNCDESFLSSVLHYKPSFIF